MLTENIILYRKEDADPSAVQLTEDLLNIYATEDPSAVSAGAVYLQADADGLALAGNGCLLRGDFTRELPRLVPNNLNRELLVKAARLKGVSGTLTAVDATAGLGEDSFLLAGAGFQVHLYERNPVVAALLRDALRRGAGNPELAPVLRRMHLHIEDSITALPKLDFTPDIVVLDPMFPGRRKSGLIKKKFQLLQQLEQPCSEEAGLLEAAFSCSPRRIVVKRPMNAAPLAGVKPDYSIRGNSIRYDCIAVPTSQHCKSRTSML